MHSEGPGELFVDLAAQRRSLVDDDGRQARSTSLDRGGHAGRATADDDQVGAVVVAHSGPSKDSPELQPIWVCTRMPGATSVMQARVLDRPLTMTRQS